MIVQRCDALTHFFKGCDGCLRFGREHHALKRYTLLGAQRCHNDLAGTAPHAREIRRVQIHSWHVAEPGPELPAFRSEEHTSELQSLMRISYAVSCLKKKTNTHTTN